MSREAALLNDLFELTGGALDRATVRPPRPHELRRHARWVRVRTLGAFWERSQAGRDRLRRAMTDLLTGLSAMAQPVDILFVGTGPDVEYWCGTSAGSDAAALAALAAVLPDARLEIGRPDDGWTRLTPAFVLNGQPSATDGATGEEVDQIDSVIRGLAGRRWAFVIRAEPAPPGVAVAAVNATTARIREVATTYLLPGNAIDEHDRTARRYAELLEARLCQLEQGRLTGLWNVEAWFLADDERTAALATGLLCAAFGGAQSLPRPVRCCPAAVHGAEADFPPLSSADLAVLACPPRTEHPGFGVVEFARFGVDGRRPPATGAVSLGQVVDAGRPVGHAAWVDTCDLTRHVLVAGVTGSGKTNTAVHLLREALRAGVPCLVIESAKSEYRTLLPAAGVSDLPIFTLGNETLAPFRLNPFEVPPGTLVQTHIDYLKSLFGAAFVLYPPMPYVLEQAIQEIYDDRGWDVAANTNRRGTTSAWAFPTLTDLAHKIPQIVDRMGYDQRVTMDVKAGLLARIDQLRSGGGKGLMLDTSGSIPAEVLFDGPCLLEMKSLVSDDEKAFLIGLVLVRLYEHCEARGPQTRLRHLTLIEEAHRLLRNTSTDQSSEVSANPRGRAIEVFANMLSEVRAYGEGIVLAEQVPTKLVPDAIKNTNLKIVHRLVAADDRARLGEAMRLTDRQQRRLSLLETGEAVVFREGLLNPLMVRVPRVTVTARPVSDADVASSMAGFFARRPEVLAPLATCVSCPNVWTPAGCRRRGRPASTAPVAQAFARAFTGARLGEASAATAFDDLRHECEREAVSTGLGWACRVRHLVHEALARRARAMGWAFADLEAAMTVAMRLVDSAGAPSSRALAEFASVMAAREQVAVLPLAGCGPCRAPCRYRVDVAPAVEAGRADFRRAFVTKGVSWSELLTLCARWAGQNVPAESEERRTEATFCVAVQSIAGLGLRPGQQRELSDAVFRLLKGGGDDEARG